MVTKKTKKSTASKKLSRKPLSAVKPLTTLRIPPDPCLQ
jgi:hypothetical protein